SFWFAPSRAGFVATWRDGLRVRIPGNLLRRDPEIQEAEQGVALNTCPAASSIRHDHSTFNPQSKPRPRAGVRGLRRSSKIMLLLVPYEIETLQQERPWANWLIVASCTVVSLIALFG